MKLVSTRIPLSRKILFFKRLALYLESGIALPVACDYLFESTEDARSREVIKNVTDRILGGEPLSKALGIYPKEFSVFTRGLLTIGETVGSLPQTLQHIAELLQRHELLRKKIFNSLLYPLILIASMGAMLCFLFFFIFPKIIPIFTELRVSLPRTTRILIWFDHFLCMYWFYLLLALFTFVFGVTFMYKNLKYRSIIERILLKTPILTTFYTSYTLSLSFSMLAVQLESGVSIIPALDLLQNTLPDSLFRTALKEVQNHVTSGHTLSSGIKAYDIFPIITAQLITAGEQTGSLYSMCEQVSIVFEEQIEYLTRTLTTLLEPVLMVFMGILVGFIALGIITPIYQVTQNLSTQ